jgi:tetratricopeptide (TPR) repeat protein
MERVQPALDRATTLNARATGPSFKASGLALIGLRFIIVMTIDEGWEMLAKETGLTALMEQPTDEDKWSYALVKAASALLLARLGQTELALQRLDVLPRALEVSSRTETTGGPMACDAASALWLLNRSDYCRLLERALRDKVIAPDFRFPMRDGRLSLARVCALEGRYDEAEHWFNVARVVLDEQGARPLRAIADYDQGLMYARRGAIGDVERTGAYFETAQQQFDALGMTGWSRRVRQPGGRDYRL